MFSSPFSSCKVLIPPNRQVGGVVTAALSSGSAGTQDKCLGGHAVRNVST